MFKARTTRWGVEGSQENAGLSELVQTFWWGDSLSALASMCLKSFLDHGHSVDLYSFQSFAVPEGVQLKDARALFLENEVFFYEAGPGAGSPSAFSNLFRYRLLAERGGWWVDTDVVCLSRHMPEGDTFFAWQDEWVINTAVMRFPVGHAAMLQCLDEARRAGSRVQWGDIGPFLLTRVLADLGLTKDAKPAAICYPIPWQNALEVLNPDLTEMVVAKLEGAQLLHLWNSPLLWAGVEPNIRPPRGSYLRLLADMHPVSDWRAA